MKKDSNRLYFIDAMRAWAILMMLQGHFIDGLLDPIYKDNSLISYSIWSYFRGITAPVFFTVSGFIFTYLLIRVPQTGWQNPRVKKGIKRGIELLLIAYLLRSNLWGLLIKGEIYNTFYVVDVLHCIGFSLLAIITLYILCYKKGIWFPIAMALVGCGLFLFEPIYENWNFSYLPLAVSNYFSKANGSVFTIIPWFGYAALGSVLAYVFMKFKDYKHLYTATILSCALVGLGLMFLSSDIFLLLFELTNIKLFFDIQDNNYLFIRFGDVLVIMALFMMFRQFLKGATVLKIGQSTLTIYIVHFIILYGSLTGLGLYRFFNHSLSPTIVIIGAFFFVIICTLSSLYYEAKKSTIKAFFKNKSKELFSLFPINTYFLNKTLKIYLLRLKYFVSKLLRSTK